MELAKVKGHLGRERERVACDKSEEIYRYIFPALDGAVCEADEIDGDGTPCYHIASCLMSVDSTVPLVKMKKQHRDTWFRFYDATGTIEFYHGCPQSKNSYNRWWAIAGGGGVEER